MFKHFSIRLSYLIVVIPLVSNIFVPLELYSQDTGTSKETRMEQVAKTISNPPPKDPDSVVDTVTRTIKENVLGMLLLLLLAVVIILEVKLIKERQMTDDSAVKLIIITLIIFGSIFLVVAGYFDAKLAPAFGLLGTISGYLLGKSDTTRTNKQTDN